MAAHPATETIAAVATPPGIGGIGIIRISGPDAMALLRKIFVPHKPRAHFTSHTLYYGTIVNRHGHTLDEALAVYMRGPQTYTREDVVELHCHGSYLILQRVLRTLITWGCRLAAPGEFTKRAFLAGRIDLTRAEAVIDLLQAQTETGVRLAVNQLQGQLFTQLEAIRQHLVEYLALLEVAIDFPDDDVEIFDTDQIAARLQPEVIAPLARLIALAEQGRIVREGVKVVIAGRPNVGKSSLLNALLREERALVAPVPGTTRDTVEERIDIRGIPVHLVDTAGIRNHEDPVEALGIERARQKLAEADLVLFVVDAQAGMTARDHELYGSIREKPHLVVLNKCDLVSDEQARVQAGDFAGTRVVPVSAQQGGGIEALQEAIYQAIAAGAEFTDQMPCAPNTRHRAVLVRTLAACRRFARAMEEGAAVDLLAVEVQSALDDLGDIIGLTTPDEVLDEVFSRFCLGK
ncbi:MAG: tRNA uridine-5-carboxymethylaminomethyl(34) synthesis GTPase MnmE [Proteobacteria bacterium]|nr:tRNA uridine-5-carboxymethylaminomethyl(34) synthesis GTPase MnmE [Pseudomonadota bacterium]